MAVTTSSAARASRGRCSVILRPTRVGMAPILALALGLVTAGVFGLAVGLAFDVRSMVGAKRVAATHRNGANETAVRARAPGLEPARRARAAYGRLPLSFAPNVGQTDGRVRYLAQAAGSSLFFTDREMTLTFAKRAKAVARRGLLGTPGSGAPGFVDAWPSGGYALKLRFVGANPDVAVEAGGRGAGTLNYLVGERSKWRRGLPSYRELTYRQLWPGIDLVFRGRGSTLKYEFHVAAGADVSDIRLAYTGADRLAIGPQGSLLVRTALGTLTDARPVSYQQHGRRRIAVDSRYALRGGQSAGYGFALGGTYDRTRPLVIDPELKYSSLLGGSAFDVGFGVAVDDEGSAYVTGFTGSTDYPTTAGAFDRTYDGGDADAFVTKLTPSGSGLAYSTLLGGSDTDVARAIAVDEHGSAYVAGDSSSADYPTTPGAFDPTYNGAGDAVVTKLSPSGAALAYSTFLGGTTQFDVAIGLAIEHGRAYVTGATTSSDFPTTPGAFDVTLNSPFFADAFVTKLNRSGAALVYSTFLGGTLQDNRAQGIAVEHGHAYVTGQTSASDFPTTAGAFEVTHNGTDTEAFVTKLKRSGSALDYSTYLGAELGDDMGSGIAVDRAGSAYLIGSTTSPDYPVTLGAFDPTYNGGPLDAFVTKLNGSGSALGYSTFVGGTQDDAGMGIAIDDARNAYVGGLTRSADYPTTPDSFDRTFNGVDDGFVTKLNASGGALAYSSFLGGSDSDFARGVATNRGSVYTTGQTNSADYPTTAGAFDPTFNGTADAFVTRLNLPPE